MRSLAALLLSALALLAGCGDNGGSSRTQANYTQEMQDIQQDPGGKVESLGNAAFDPQLDNSRWRRAARLWLEEQHRALARLRRITAPSDVASLHARYLAATGTWLAATERLVRSVERGDVQRAQLERRASELGNAYAQQVGPIATEIESKGYDVFRPFDSPR